MALGEQLSLGLADELDGDIRPLASVADVICGQHLLPHEQATTGVPYITGPADFTNRAAVPSRFAAVRKSLCLPGDVLLTVKGSGLGKVNLAPSVPAVIGRQLFALRPHASTLDSIFLWRLLQYKLASLREEATSTTVPGIGRDAVQSLMIPVPPLSEQRRIVARIEELAGRIERARGLRRAAAEEVRTIVASARSQIFENALTDGTTRLDNLATLERGRFSHRPRNEPRFFGGEHPWIQIAEIEQADMHIKKWTQTLNDEGLKISRKFPKGTLLISIAATIGAVGILDFDCCIPDSIVAITPKRDTVSEYLYHYLCFVRSNLELIAPQSAQKNINLKILAPLQIPALPGQEQRRIATYLNRMQARAEAVKRLQAESAAELAALLPAVLARAFRGEL